MQQLNMDLAIQLVTNGRKLRNDISKLLREEVQLSHELSDRRKAAQVVSDQIVNEIWSSEAYKNDKARNEQKHLAAINDPRIIEPGEVIRKLELQRADVQGRIITCQDLLAYNTIEYELTVLGSRRLQVSYQVGAVISEGVDTIKRAALDSAVESLMTDPAQLDQFLKQAQAEAAAPADQPGNAVSTETEAVPVDPKKEQAEAPYLKNTSDKTPGKLGGVRY